METTELLLSRHPFFKGVHEWYIEQLARYASFAEYKDQDHLIREGEEASKFFLILEGKVKVGTMVGKKFIPIQNFSANDIVGWSWLLNPHVWNFDAVAEGPVKVIVLDGKYLRAKCEEDPVLGYELLKRLTQHVVDRLKALRLKVIGG